MALNLDTAIKLTAQVQGANNIRGVATNLQQLNASAQLTGRQLDRLYTETQRLAGAAGNSINALRQQRQALTTLRDAAEPTSRRFQLLTRDIDQLDARLRRLNGASKEAAGGLRGALSSAAGATVMGGGPGAAIGALGGSLAASGGAAGLAAAGGLAAAAGLTVASVANARELEAQTRRLRVMTEQGDLLQQQIVALTREQGHLASTTEATAAAYDILQAGFNNNADILQILRAATLGATAGFTDITTVADATTSILNGFGMSASEASRIVDQMKATTDDGKISMEAYAQSIGRVVPSAAAAKVSFEEVNAAISALTAQGVPAETTFSGLNQVIKTILKPTKEASDLAAALGLEFNAQALAAKGLGGFLEDVAAKTGKSSDALGILFSDIDGYKAVVALLNDDLQRFNKFTDNQANAIGKAGTAAEKAIDPLKRFDNTWKDLTSTLGQLVLPAINGVLGGLTNVLQRILELPPALQGMGQQLIQQLPLMREFAAGMQFVQGIGTLAGLGGRSAPAPTAAAQGASAQFGPPVPRRLQAAAATHPPALAGALAAARGQATPTGTGGTGGTTTAERDRADADARRRAEALGDHQRQVDEAVAQERDAMALATFNNQTQLEDQLYRLRTERIQREHEYQQQLQDARWDLEVAQTRERDRWAVELRRRLFGIIRDGGNQVVQLQRDLANAEQRLATARRGLQAAAMEQRPTVISTSVPASGGASGGSATAQTIAVTLMSRLNLTLEQVSGVIGNLMRESGLNPRINEGGAVGLPRGVGGYGLAQWTGPRQTNLVRFAGSGARAGELGTQLEFMIRELLGPEGRALASLRQARTPEQAAYVFDRDFERSGIKAMGERQGGARRVFQQLAGRLPGGVAATTAGDLTTMLPASQTGVLGAQGEVDRAQAEVTAAREALARVTGQLKELQPLQIQTELVNSLNTINQPLENAVKASGDRLAYEREYAELLRTGIGPELAQEFAQIDQIGQERRRQLEQQASMLDSLAQQAGLSEEQRKALQAGADVAREQLQQQQGTIDALREELRLRERIARASRLQQDTRIGQGAREGVDAYLESIGTMRTATAQLTTEALGGLEDQLTMLATTGKANFQEFAVSVLQSTARMIIQQMVLGTILRAIGGAAGGAGGGVNLPTADVTNMVAGFPTTGFSFAGGGYTGDGARSGGLDGQGGFLAMLHPRETVVDHTRGQAVGGGPTYVNVTVNTTTGQNTTEASDNNRRQLGRDLAAVVDARLAHHKRPGGLLHPDRRM